MNTVTKQETAGSMLGVQGRFFGVVTASDGIIRNQKFISERRAIEGWGAGATICAEVRFDDQCNNGHESFAITAEIRRPGRRDCESCGCLHDEIAKVFHELAPLIKWHLVSTNSPMHYVANTVYQASDRDHNGKAKGEPIAFDYALTFNGVPALHMVKPAFYKFLKANHENRETLAIVEIEHAKDEYKFAPKYSISDFCNKWHECPFDSKIEAVRFLKAFQTCVVTFDRIATKYSEGKARNFDGARACGVWPEATDEDLSMPRAKLEAALKARLPALVAEFKAAMIGAGFVYPTYAKGE